MTSDNIKLPLSSTNSHFDKFRGTDEMELRNLGSPQSMLSDEKDIYFSEDNSTFGEWPKPRQPLTRWQEFKQEAAILWNIIWVAILTIIGKPPLPEEVDDQGEKRVIFSNEHELNQNQKFLTNYVRTTQYTLINFLPKNIFQQLQKAANFYFFALAIIVSIPGVSPIPAWTNITPLVIVLTVTAIREAYEDWKRYMDDQEVNSRPATVLRHGKLLQIQWKDVVVGDIVKVYEDSPFPADLILLSSSRETGDCSIETSSLDGETALKTKNSLRQTRPYTDVNQLARIKASVKCDPPNSNLHWFEGQFIAKQHDKCLIFSISTEELLLRGTSLMNTEFIWGLVIYTGKETKIYLNLNEPPHKRTRVEQTTNEQMYKIFIFLFFLCFAFAIVYGSIRIDMAKEAWYLDYSDSDKYPSISDNFAAGIRDWAAFLILYSLLVPISLYVSMELVRVAQTLIINMDGEMYDPISNVRAKCRTAALNEQLGEIEYVFCDKTGTLTENQMAFAKCSIGGIPYGVDDHIGHSESEEVLRADDGKRRGNNVLFPEMRLDDPKLRAAVASDDKLVRDFFLNLALCHTVQPLNADESDARDQRAQKEKEEAGKAAAEMENPDISPKQSGHLGHFPKPILPPSESVQGAADANYDSPSLRRHSFSISDRGDFRFGNIAYQASSPDEMALVTAARAMGYFFHTRGRDHVQITTPLGEESYDILQVLEFTSDRKRMSVIVRAPDKRVLLFTKGADSIVLGRCSPPNPEVLAESQGHLEQFSKLGLRVMILAQKEIPHDEYQEWA